VRVMKHIERVGAEMGSWCLQAARSADPGG